MKLIWLQAVVNETFTPVIVALTLDENDKIWEYTGVKIPPEEIQDITHQTGLEPHEIIKSRLKGIVGKELTSSEALKRHPDLEKDKIIHLLRDEKINNLL